MARYRAGELIGLKESRTASTRGRLWRTLVGVGTAGLASVALAACGASSASSISSSKVTLTLWQNYGTETNATATTNLVTAFEKAHPNIKIKVVAQPASNYFALLQAAAISHSGPDLAVMWTGLFTLQYKSYLQNLKQWVPKADLNRMGGMRWTSPGFNTANGSYVVPLEDQFYIGFYNKNLFTKAGISSPPKTWTQLYGDCSKFKAMGVTCLDYGAGSQNLGAEFYPWYDMSYMMIGNYSLSQWESLYSGKIPWTSPGIVAQFARWQRLHSDGYTNPNVVTSIGSVTNFQNGKSAMLIKGNWDLAQLYKAMGSNLGTFVPPFSTSPVHGVVQFPGDGYAMTSYSQHKAQAAEFLRFLTTPQAGKIVAASGLIPDVKGVSSRNPVAQQMLAFAAKDGFIKYPMLDNVTAPNVVSAGSKVMPELLDGQISPKQAASKIEQAWKQLPPQERGSTWGTYQVG
jgi:raffinose/stachyose/melibiose transport system substrate-binding protein